MSKYLIENLFGIEGWNIAWYGVITALVFCRIKKLSFLQFADILLPSLVLGQSIGRWGNFMNQEAYGNLVTNPNLQFFPYAVYIEASGNWHQATFLSKSVTYRPCYRQIVI